MNELFNMAIALHYFHAISSLLCGAFATRGIYYKRIYQPRGVSEAPKDLSESKPIIIQSFHQCSMNKVCNYVIKTTGNDASTLYNKDYEVPHQKADLQIWKKMYQGPFEDIFKKKSHIDEGAFTTKMPIIGLSTVRYDMTTKPSGWIVFQRRVDATVDFNRKWADYKKGFGDLNGNFWLGLEKLHQLAQPGKGVKLRIDLKHRDRPGKSKFAEYSTFEVSDESDGYRLIIGGYSGNAGDCMYMQNGMQFTTYDKDNDQSPNNCAILRAGPWWYKRCGYANLNSLFPSSQTTDGRQQIGWLRFTRTYGGIVFSEMKLI